MAHDSFSDPVLIDRIVDELEAGHNVAMATIAAIKGSMPRGEGARLCVFEDDSFEGTIGGGAIELMCIDYCQELVHGEREQSFKWYKRADTMMACGGDALVDLRLITPSELDIFKKIQKTLKDGELVWYTEDFSDPENVKVELLNEEQTKEAGFNTGCDVCFYDTDRTLLIEPIGPEPICYIFGAGHVGQALVPELTNVGWSCKVLDDREELLTKERFPEAVELEYGDFNEMAAKANITNRDYVVVMTHGHTFDIDILERVIPKHAVYTGCIGSRAKAKYSRQQLVKRGISQADADAVHLPIGDEILAVTPAEIAVSIAAEMIRARAMTRPVKPHEKPSDPH